MFRLRGGMEGVKAVLKVKGVLVRLERVGGVEAMPKVKAAPGL